MACSQAATRVPLRQQKQERQPTRHGAARRDANGNSTLAPDRWHRRRNRTCSRRPHGRSSLWSWPAWCSACSPCTQTALSSPRFARSGAPPRGSSRTHQCRHRPQLPPRGSSCQRYCRCSHSPAEPSTASLTASPYTSPDVALPVTKVSAADGSSSSVTMGASWLTPFSSEKVTLPSLLSVRLRPPNAFPDWSYKYGTIFPYPYYTWMHIEVSEKLRIRKLILCSANLVAALVGTRRSQILIRQPGALTWSVLAHHELKRFEDMAFYKGRLYVITNDENLLVVNISQDQSTGDPQVSKIGRVIKEKGDHGCYETVVVRDNFKPHKKLYLVESCGNLLMVRRTIWLRDPDLLVRERYAVGPSKFEVLEADLEHSWWVKVSPVGGDRVLFLGRRCSRSVPVAPCLSTGCRVIAFSSWMNMLRRILLNTATTWTSLPAAPMT